MKNFQTYTTASGWKLKHWCDFVSARQVALALGYTHSRQVLGLGIPYLQRGNRCIFRLQDVANYIDSNIKQGK
jgi:hypothetical protein